MRILHTGDWHLNHRLGRKDMTLPLQETVEQVASHLEAEEADVLLIAGDLFMGRESRDQLRASLRFLKQKFEPFLKRGGTIIVLYGNHDNENFFLMLQDFGDMVSTVDFTDGIHSPGRIYVAPKPDILRLRAKSGLVTQFVLLPYPIPTAYMPAGESLSNDPDQRLAAMTDRYRNTLVALCNRVDKSLPSILVGHITIRGTAIADLFRPQSREVTLEIGGLPTHFAYGAFGHIHRPGPVSQGLNHFRYCGSLLPLDSGEAGQQKSVTLIEVGQAGLVSQPRMLPITGPHLRKLVIDANEVDNLAAKFLTCDANCTDTHCHETALVRYTLRYPVATYPDPYPLHRKIQEFFPNWYDNDFDPVQTGVKPSTGGGGEGPGQDMEKNILFYLENLAEFSGRDAEKSEVLALAGALLSRNDLLDAIQNPEITKNDIAQSHALFEELLTVRMKEAGE